MRRNMKIDVIELRACASSDPVYLLWGIPAQHEKDNVLLKLLETMNEIDQETEDELDESPKDFLSFEELFRFENHQVDS